MINLPRHRLGTTAAISSSPDNAQKAETPGRNLLLGLSHHRVKSFTALLAANDSYLVRRRRTAPAAASRPVPNKAILLGSGTGGTEVWVIVRSAASRTPGGPLVSA